MNADREAEGRLSAPGDAKDAMKTPRHVFVGTSGWYYPHWVGPFYPAGLKQDRFLSYYADRFQSVEINHSFYKLPEIKALKAWKDTVPQDFTFSVKASRYITHMKKLKDTEESLSLFLERIDFLGEKLGPVLFQLPGRWGYNRERFYRFLHSLPAGYRFAFELRDPSWHNCEVYEALQESGAALCIHEIAGWLSPVETPGSFAYVRLHGPGAAYQGRYGPQALSEWAGALAGWAERGADSYCYFDNDEAGYAAENALMLQSMLGVGRPAA